MAHFIRVTNPDSDVLGVAERYVLDFIPLIGIDAEAG